MWDAHKKWRVRKRNYGSRATMGNIGYKGNVYSVVVSLNERHIICCSCQKDNPYQAVMSKRRSSNQGTMEIQADGSIISVPANGPHVDPTWSMTSLSIPSYINILAVIVKTV